MKLTQQQYNRLSNKDIYEITVLQNEYSKIRQQWEEALDEYLSQGYSVCDNEVLNNLEIEMNELQMKFNTIKINATVKGVAEEMMK